MMRPDIAGGITHSNQIESRRAGVFPLPVMLAIDVIFHKFWRYNKKYLILFRT